MNAAINEAMRRPDVSAKLEQLGLLPVFGTPQQYALALKQERATWAAFIKNKLRFETSPFRGIEFIWERGNSFQISLKLCLGVD